MASRAGPGTVMGLRARTPESAVALALTTPGSGDQLLQLLGERVALGLASIVAVLDPPSSCSAAGS